MTQTSGGVSKVTGKNMQNCISYLFYSGQERLTATPQNERASFLNVIWVCCFSLIAVNLFVNIVHKSFTAVKHFHRLSKLIRVPSHTTIHFMFSFVPTGKGPKTGQHNKNIQIGDKYVLLLTCHANGMHKTKL